jgi:NAD(P)-dependent dehydrogenase (short-subunit alcohol dehydrogenase family)
MGSEVNMFSLFIILMLALAWNVYIDILVTCVLGNKFATAYSASKFAVRGLTQSAAEELGPHKITVNAYAPGYVDTELTMKSGMPSLKEGEYLELGAKESVLGYNAVPDDMAGLVSYIASKEAHFVTGQTISINGGLFFD